MSNNNLVLDKLPNGSLGHIERDGMFRGNICFGNTGYEGPVVGNLLFDTDHCVVKNGTVVIYESNPSKAGVGSAGSDTDHFGIEGDVARFFFWCEK